MIFHDATLEELAALKPSDHDALRAVRGVGPAKIETYGEAVLQVLGDSPRSSGPESKADR